MALSAASINQAAQSAYGIYPKIQPPSPSQPPSLPSVDIKSPNKMYGPVNPNGAQGNISANPEAIGNQSAMQSAAGASPNVDTNLTPDAYAGNLAMALRQAAGVSPAPTNGVSPNGSPLPAPGPLQPSGAPNAGNTPTSATPTLASVEGMWAPELVAGANYGSQGAENAGNSNYQQVTNAPGEVSKAVSQLSPTDQLAYQVWLDRQKNTQQEQADVPNTVFNAQASAKASEAQFADKVLQNDEEHKNARNQLVNTLAARGLSVNTDSYAQAQMAQMDNLYAQKSQILEAEQEANRANLPQAIRDSLAKDRQSRLDQINKEMDQLNAANLTASKAANTQSLIGTRLSKEQIDALKTAGILSVDQANALYKGAQTDYLTGAKTDLTEAQAGLAGANTAKSEAQTNQINVLTPLDAQKIQAQLGKLKGTGAGGSYTSADVNKILEIGTQVFGTAATTKQNMAAAKAIAALPKDQQAQVIKQLQQNISTQTSLIAGSRTYATPPTTGASPTGGTDLSQYQQ